jgi:hypothetical protein
VPYGARRVWDAERAWPLVLGNSTYWPRPLSVRTVLAVEAEVVHPDPLRRLVVALRAIREAFPPPRGWRRFTWSNPERTILQDLDEANQTKVLRAILYGPPSKALAVPKSEPEDLYEKMRRKHLQMVSATPDGLRPVSLAVMVATLRATFGDAWYWNPERYDTVDGYVDARTVMADYEAAMAVQAARQLEAAKTAVATRASAHDWQDFTRELIERAYPLER